MDEISMSWDDVFLRQRKLFEQILELCKEPKTRRELKKILDIGHNRVDHACKQLLADGFVKIIGTEVRGGRMIQHDIVRFKSEMDAKWLEMSGSTRDLNEESEMERAIIDKLSPATSPASWWVQYLITGDNNAAQV